jgi:hypothetical protein
MFSKKFWKDAFERTVSTFAESALGIIIVATGGLLEVDWISVLSVAGAAALVAVLKSIAAANRGNSDSGSLLQNH